MYFFFPKTEKKKTKFSVNELVSRPQTLPAKKKYGTFAWSSVFFSTWKTQSFTWKKSKKVPVKRKNFYVKTKNSKNVCVKPKKCAWKCLKCQKSARESKKLCVKTVEKVCVKANFCAWKKLKKGHKIVSRTLLVFTWKKKNTALHHS